MPAKTRVIVDEREKASGIPDLLKTLGLQVEHRMLDVGDYLISPEYAVERKEEGDFFKSLYSGRLFDQAHRLSETYERPVVIVEGDISSFTERMASPRVFWGALTTLTFEYGLNVFFTANAKQTANLIYTITKHKGFARPKGPLVRKTRKKGALEKIQTTLVSGLPGIGPKLAIRMLEKFGNVRSVFSASVAELSLVKGIGRITAEKIAKFLDAPYRPVTKMPQQLQLDKA